MHAWCRAIVAAVFATLTVAATPAPSTPPPSEIAYCTAAQLSAGTDAENGAFNGMSHSGTLLVLRNVSNAPCRFDPFVRLTAFDAAGKPLDLVFQNAPGFPSGIYHGVQMGHGPVVFPLAIAAGAEATSALRWVDQPVYDHSACVQVTSVMLRVGRDTTRVPLSAHICGADAASSALRPRPTPVTAPGDAGIGRREQEAMAPAFRSSAARHFQ